MKEKTGLSEYFGIEFGVVENLRWKRTRCTLADGNMELDSGNMGFLRRINFPSAIKTFLFQKNKIIL